MSEADRAAVAMREARTQLARAWSLTDRERAQARLDTAMRAYLAALADTKGACT